MESSKSSEKEYKNKDGSPTMAKALDDFRRAFEYKKRFLDQADDDFKVALGEQWDSDDVAALDEVGVKALSINKIGPIIRLMKGIESQNRTDPKAYPEGKEDSIEAQIATGLLRNSAKNAGLKYEISDMFDDGNTCGESFLEPYIDYTDNIIVGKMMLRKNDYWYIFPDPDARKYDFSDGQFVAKVTYDLTKDQLLMMFPDKESVIDGLESGKITFNGNTVNSTDALGVELQRRGYSEDDSEFSDYHRNEKLFDLLEYYYKRYVTKYYVGDKKLGGLKLVESKADAKDYVDAANAQDPDSAALITRHEPEVWVMSIIGGLEDALSNEKSWSFPRWKGWPIIPYYAYRSSARIGNKHRHLKVQGVTRQLKDPQFEFNKRRTQELRHLNQSANSGWLAVENSWVDRAKVEKFGSASGINLEFKADAPFKPERIMPTPLSQGHAQLAQEHSADMKEISGINTDLLAQAEMGSDSGRAIALRQKQGLTMVQGLFDNLARTKEIVGKFILSQLSEMYTVESAMRVLGESFIQENFSVPVMQPVVDPATGQAIGQAPVIDPMTGQPAMQVDQQAAAAAFNKVLNDTELGDYDVAVGETVASESTQFANFMMISELQQQGMPIPPDVLIDESLLPQSSKNRIKAAIQAAQAAQMNNGGENAKRPKEKAAV